MGAGAHVDRSGFIYVDDAEIAGGLKIPTLVIWRPSESRNQSADWVAAEAAQCQSTIQEIRGKVPKGDITP